MTQDKPRHPIDSPRQIVPLDRTASAEAPFIHFDFAGPFDTSPEGDGLHITLTALKYALGDDGKLLTERATVAHLRFGRSGLAALKEAIDSITLLMAQAQGGGKN